ncbi:MAG: serine/threonine protein kinase [Ktedonobacteraceae bacterium]
MVEDIYYVGSVIQDRYLVEDILGMGGFSIVYLVRDQQLTNEQSQKQEVPGNRFALKMSTDRNKLELSRFLFEGELLTRLHHHALPRIHRVFEDETSHRTCILMDYVEGTNLNILRKRQPEDRFSLSETLAVLAPVVEALAYLHAQPSPIIHRDVKPANLIAQKDGTGAVLVDFGIAKEYEMDATTTAVRHCSPGYGAPEQYSSIGTDQRTDIYGLGATIYALLTGSVPVDALQRATKLASKEIDPLIPAHQLVPSIPTHVSAALQRAMSIGMGKRFSSVGEFWHAVQAVDTGGLDDAITLDDRRSGRMDRVDRRQRWGGRPGRLRLLLLAALALLLVGGLAFGFGTYVRGNHSFGAIGSSSSHGQGISIAKPTVVPPTRVVPRFYPVLAQRYDGSVRDLLTSVTTSLTITSIQQNNEQISGSFSGLHTQGSFTGVLDTSRHIFFTVSGQPPLFFQGAVRSDGNLVGNYCTVDSAGQCVGNYGIWSLAPVDA